MLLKSYEKDLASARRLVDSFNGNNPENLHLFIVVAEKDMDLFVELANDNITVMTETPFCHYFTDTHVAGIRPGYINQEIVKLAFWELDLAENYFCVDSDAVFIRPFTAKDFMLNDFTPYTVLVEDNELKVEPTYYAQHWQGREVHLRHIQELVGLQDRRILTCHGHQVFSARVLKSLKGDFLTPRGWTYLDMLAEGPYEFSWYNFWLQKSLPIEIAIREPLVKVFHNQDQHLEYAMRGIGQADIARGYVAVVINSNFADSWGQLSASEPATQTIARYVSWKTLLQVLKAKTAAVFTRR
jgi:hypothetical protein